MAKIEPIGCVDGVVNGGFIDKELDILSILDFPIESLEADEFAEDWDVSKFHWLEPIPSDLLGSSLLPYNQIRPPFLSPTPIVPLDEISRPKPETKQFADASDSCVRRHEPRVYQSQSPVSVLRESSQIRKGARSKRAKPTGHNPWGSNAPIVITSRVSRKTCNRVKNASSKRAKNSLEASSIDSSRSLENPNGCVKMCSHCQSTQTPQWREGPMGPQTLCNACGVRYRTGRLFPEYRPASSPSFVPSLHSNCHKKVMEMRNRAKLQ